MATPVGSRPDTAAPEEPEEEPPELDELLPDEPPEELELPDEELDELLPEPPLLSLLPQADSSAAKPSSTAAGLMDQSRMTSSMMNELEHVARAGARPVRRELGKPL
jgi:hypothetical protein